MVFMRGRHLCARDGFTLVEVMVVVLVIGVLIAIGLPMFLGAKSVPKSDVPRQKLRTGLTAGRPHLLDRRWNIHGVRPAAQLCPASAASPPRRSPRSPRWDLMPRPTPRCRSYSCAGGW